MTIKSNSLTKKDEKRVKVGIIEIYSHHVFVHTLALVLQKCGMDVTIYTSPRIYKDLVPLFDKNHDEFSWVVSKPNENNFYFMKRIRKEINSDIDLLFCNSVQGIRVGLFWLFNFKVKTIAGAGRISDFFGIEYKLFGHPTFRKLLQHNYTRYFLQKCLPRFKALITHTSQATDFSIDHGYKKPILQMPFSLYKENVVYNRVENELHFVITGSIQKACRDHDGVLNVFEKLWQKGYDGLKLTVLSNAKRKQAVETLSRMETLKAKGYNIHYYTSWIDEVEFLRVADIADIFISPLNLSYYSCGELTSGIVEVIRQGKPGIYPDGYLPDKTIESSSLSYNSLDHLEDLVESLLNDNDKVRLLSENAISNSEKYSLNNVAKKFENKIKHILSL